MKTAALARMRISLVLLIPLFLAAGCADCERIDSGAMTGSGEPVASDHGDPREAVSAAWPTYRNRELGFSLRHPPAWRTAEARPDGADSGPLLRVRFSEAGEGRGPLADRAPAPFMLEVFANPRGLDPAAWLDEHGWPFAESTRQAMPLELGGLPALSVETRLMLAPNRFVYLSTGSLLLRFTPLAAESQAVLESFRIEDHDSGG